MTPGLDERHFEVGDAVRFTTFGEWMSGVVQEVREPLVRIEVVAKGVSVWRNVFVHHVVKEHTGAADGSSTNRAEAVAEATPESSGSGSVSAVGGEGT